MTCCAREVSELFSRNFFLFFLFKRDILRLIQGIEFLCLFIPCSDSGCGWLEVAYFRIVGDSSSANNTPRLNSIIAGRRGSKNPSIKLQLNILVAGVYLPWKYPHSVLNQVRLDRIKTKHVPILGELLRRARLVMYMSNLGSNRFTRVLMRFVSANWLQSPAIPS